MVFANICPVDLKGNVLSIKIRRTSCIKHGLFDREMFILMI